MTIVGIWGWPLIELALLAAVVMVGAAPWLVYLRRSRQDSPD